MDTFCRELTFKELEEVAGGHPFEECFGDNDLYRAGVTYKNTVFGSDEYYIGSRKISKDLARKLRQRSPSIWKKYSAKGDYVGYAREWKAILLDEYGIEWDGQLGHREVQAW